MRLVTFTFPSLGVTHFTTNFLKCNFILEIIEAAQTCFTLEVITNIGKQGYIPVISALLVEGQSFRQSIQ